MAPVLVILALLLQAAPEGGREAGRAPAVAAPTAEQVRAWKAELRRTDSEIRRLRAALADRKYAASEMGRMDMLQLQQLMERKGQLESLIDN